MFLNNKGNILFLLDLKQLISIKIKDIYYVSLISFI